MMHVLLAAAAFALGVIAHRILTTPEPTPAKRITDSFWNGYRRGVLAEREANRTPSPN